MKTLRIFSKFSVEFNRCVYVNGNSSLSLSQMIGGNKGYITPLMNNFYIKEHTEHQVKHEGLIMPDIIERQQLLLQSVLKNQLIVRCIIAPEISKKQMNLNINKLKKNPLLNHLIHLQEKHKFKFSTPRIIINSYMHADQTRQILSGCESKGIELPLENDLPVHQAKGGKDFIPEQVWIDKGVLVKQIEEHLRKNIIEIEKLFTDGLSLDVSFMLSKRNIHQPIKSGQKQKGNFWLNSIAKKSKAINSNIIENGLKFQESVYEEGYQLHHIFLSSYDQRNSKIPLLQHNKAYNLKQVVYIMKMINFNGKVVLDCQRPGIGEPEDFLTNLEYLDKALRENGYKKKDIRQQDDKSYISAL